MQSIFEKFVTSFVGQIFFGFIVLVLILALVFYVPIIAIILVVVVICWSLGSIVSDFLYPGHDTSEYDR